MFINRYILKVPVKILRCTSIGDPIISDHNDPEKMKLLGFIGNVFKESKALEICLFNSIDMKVLKVKKNRILYYESNYNTKQRYEQMKRGELNDN